MTYRSIVIKIIMNNTRKVLNLRENKIVQENTAYKPAGNKEKERLRFLAMMKVASELGFSISLPIVGGAWIGHIIDQKFGIAPRITLSLIFTGIIISISSIILILKESDK